MKPASPAETEWVASQRKWTRGWRRVVFPGVFLVYLVEVGAGVAQFSKGLDAVLGYLILAGFAGCYLSALPESWHVAPRRFWVLYGASVTPLCR